MDRDTLLSPATRSTTGSNDSTSGISIDTASFVSNGMGSLIGSLSNIRTGNIHLSPQSCKSDIANQCFLKHLLSGSAVQFRADGGGLSEKAGR